MRFKSEYLHCDSTRWLQTSEIGEIETCIANVPWIPNANQAKYNEILRSEFIKLSWMPSPKLYDKESGSLVAPRLDLDYCFQNPPTLNLYGDFRKGVVFVEVEFGNRASVFRDYFKFLCGASFQLFELGVLIAAVDPPRFFPEGDRSIPGSMASFDYAHQHLRVLPFTVPMLLIGLLPEN